MDADAQTPRYPGLYGGQCDNDNAGDRNDG
jgi:hypothetical protein